MLIFLKSIEQIGALLTPALLVLAIAGGVYSIWCGSWRKDSLNMCIGVAIISMLGWRMIIPLESSRYFAILLFPAIFLVAFLWGNGFYRKWTFSLLVIVGMVIMLVKDFRYTSEDQCYLSLAAVIKNDLAQGEKSIFVTLSNDYNKHLYCLRGSGIKTLDLSEQSTDIQNFMLNEQLPLNYDSIYVSEKRKKNVPNAVNLAGEYSVLCQYPIGKNRQREMIVLKGTGQYSKILPEMQKAISLPVASEMDIIELMPQELKEEKRKRLLELGFSAFNNHDFELPRNWSTEIYSDSAGKEQSYVTAVPSEGVFAQTPQSLSIVYDKRLALETDYYMVVDMTAMTPVTVKFGSHNYTADNMNYEGSVIYGTDFIKPENRQLVFFYIKGQDVKEKSINLRLVIEEGKIMIHHIYFFPCQLIDKMS